MKQGPTEVVMDNCPPGPLLRGGFTLVPIELARLLL